MYDTDFKRRVNIQQICSFIKVGFEETDDDAGTPNERLRRHSRIRSEGIQIFRERVLAYDWDGCASENEKAMATENLFQDVMLACADIESLAFEMGFCTGIKVGNHINAYVTQTEDEDF